MPMGNKQTRCYSGICSLELESRRVWRYQRGNQNPYIEEDQTTQWPKKKYKRTNNVRSTKHTHKTEDRVTRTQLKTGGELRCSGRVSSSCFTSGIHRVNLVMNPVISDEWGKDREVFTTSGTYLWFIYDTNIPFNNKLTVILVLFLVNVHLFLYG